MRTALTLLLLALMPLSMMNGRASTDLSYSETDYIFLKDVAGKLGYVMISGEVSNVTRNHVLFVREGSDVTYLYTRDDVRRIELGRDDDELRKIVDRYWNDKDVLDRGERSLPEWGSDLIASVLPSAILTGFLVLVGLYLLASTLLQAYQRFVLEGNIKRLNTEKLLNEIEKLRVEVLEMRQRLGLSISEEELLTLEDRFDHKHVVTELGMRPAERRVNLLDIHLPEIHFVDFIKHKILHFSTPEEFESRKQSLADRWQNEKNKNAAWLKVRYVSYATVTTIAIWLGWFFALGSIGNIAFFFTEPLYREELGAGFPILFIITGVVLIVAVIRLGQKRKLRKLAYRQIFSPQ